MVIFYGETDMVNLADCLVELLKVEQAIVSRGRLSQ